MPKHFVSQTVQDLKNKPSSTKQLIDRQMTLNLELKKSLRIDPIKSKSVLIELVKTTMSDPIKIEMLHNVKEYVNEMTEEFFKDENVLRHMVMTSIHDYSTSIHITNAMLFAFTYGFHEKLPMDMIKELCLAALMHDIGKIEIPDYILQANRKLSPEEFEIVKNHPVDGFKILADTNFPDAIKYAAKEHHEKLDGSGYPDGMTNPRHMSRIITVIDIFEALTNWRPYKSEMNGYTALEIMKTEEVETGNIDEEVFRKFAYSLIGMKMR